MQPDAGWDYSARAYIAWIDRGAPERELLLDPVMLRLCGDVAGARVLDVGCGEGRFCRMMASRGATAVGIDPTAAMIRAAKGRDVGGACDYVRAAGERQPFADATFDLVLSYVTLVDIEGYRDAIAEMARVLRPGGHLVVANLSFVTASAGWFRDAEGNRLYHRVDRYLEDRPITLVWSDMSITNWHRPLTAYMAAYLGAGLILRDFLEPAPDTDALRDDPYFEDWYRIPDFTVMRWQKPV